MGEGKSLIRLASGQVQGSPQAQSVQGWVIQDIKVKL